MQISAGTCSIFLIGSEYWISIFYAFFVFFSIFFLSQGTANNPNALKTYQKVVYAPNQNCVE